MQFFSHDLIASISFNIHTKFEVLTSKNKKFMNCGWFFSNLAHCAILDGFDYFFTILISMTCILYIYRLYKGLLCGKFSQMHNMRSTTRDGGFQNNNKGVSFWNLQTSSHFVFTCSFMRVILKEFFSSQSWARLFLIHKIYVP